MVCQKVVQTFYLRIVICPLRSLVSDHEDLCITRHRECVSYLEQMDPSTAIVLRSLQEDPNPKLPDSWREKGAPAANTGASGNAGIGEPSVENDLVAWGELWNLLWRSEPFWVVSLREDYRRGSP